MTRLVRQNRTYEPIFYHEERHFQAIVKSQLAKVLPRFSIQDFSPSILGDEGIRRKPDLALVHRSYDMWAVVEVELENHHLELHVLPQVRTFVTGRYDWSHAALLHQKDSTLDLERLRNLTMYVHPLVLVVVNSQSVMSKGWDILESEHSVPLTFVESYRSNDGDVIVSISGHIPVPPPRLGSRMSLKKQTMLNALVCTHPGDVPTDILDSIELFLNDFCYTWSVIRTSDSVLFLPPGGVTIRDNHNYQIHRTDEGKYELQEL